MAIAFAFAFQATSIVASCSISRLLNLTQNLSTFQRSHVQTEKVINIVLFSSTMNFVS